MMPDQAIIASLRQRGIARVYHFIRLGHVPNVLARGGLWCAKQLREWGDEFDDDWSKWGGYEKAKSYSGHVSCSVNSPMGMMTKDRKPVLLALKSSVAAIPGSVFVGKWSSWGDVDPESTMSQTGVEWFDKMFLGADRYRANPHPGEFLVPNCIPVDSIEALIFHSQDDYDELAKLLAGRTFPTAVSLKAAIKPTMFGTKMQETGEGNGG